MDELQKKVEKYEKAFEHLLPKMMEMEKERNEWQQKAIVLQKERDQLQREATEYKGMFKHVMSFVQEVVMDWPVEKVQKKRKRDWNSDEESDEEFQDLLRIRTAFEAKRDFLHIDPQTLRSSRRWERMTRNGKSDS